MNENVVIASGFFNPLHEGHLDYLEGAAKLGPLYVIVNNDRQVSLKGSRKFLPEQTRLRIVSALKCVWDATLAIDDDLSVSLSIERLYYLLVGICPVKYFANGGDVTGGAREEEVCKRLGITCVYGVGGAKVNSSSDILMHGGINDGCGILQG